MTTKECRKVCDLFGVIFGEVIAEPEPLAFSHALNELADFNPTQLFEIHNELYCDDVIIYVDVPASLPECPATTVTPISPQQQTQSNSTCNVTMHIYE